MSAPIRSVSQLREELDKDAERHVNDSPHKCVSHLLTRDSWTPGESMLRRCVVCWPLALSPLDRFRFTLWIDQSSGSAEEMVVRFKKLGVR